jgi:uncharacterized membrane protein
MSLLGWVTNTGNVTLTNVTIVVDKPEPNTLFFGPVTLAPGQAAGYIGSFTVPTNVNACSIASTVTARGNSKCTGASVNAAASRSCPVITSPKIVVTKSCPPGPVAPGAQMVISGTILNAGDTVLTNIVVLNDRPATNTTVFAVRSLAPGQSTNFTASYVTPSDCCTVTDTLTATGRNQCDGAVVTDTSTSICPVLFCPLSS